MLMLIDTCTALALALTKREIQSFGLVNCSYHPGLLRKSRVDLNIIPSRYMHFISPLYKLTFLGYIFKKKYIKKKPQKTTSPSFYIMHINSIKKRLLILLFTLVREMHLIFSVIGMNDSKNTQKYQKVEIVFSLKKPFTLFFIDQRCKAVF